MNMLRSSLFGVLVLTAFTGWAGGKSTNGGGGNKKASDFKAMGLGALIAASAENPPTDQVRAWVAERGESLVSCPLSFRKYPALPAELSKRVRLLIEIEGPGESSKKGADRLFLPRKTILAPLNSRTICVATQSALNAYISFVMAVYPGGKEMDLLVRNLLDESGTTSNPLTVALHERPALIAARGESIEETSWFEHESGTVHWSRPAPRDGLLMLTGRSSTQILRHELAHVFLKRVMGTSYPAQEPYWHDTRYLSEMHGGHLGDGAVAAFKFETSQAAAFVEGFAYAMEGTLSSEHLWIERMGNVFQVLQGFDGDKRACYFAQNYSWIRDGGRRFEAPLRSEVYVGSALADFAVYSYPNSDAESGNPTEAPGVYTGTDIKVLLGLLAAFKSRPTLSVAELVREYDRQQGVQDGWLWLREFFFTDYKTGKNTAEEFTVVERDTKDDLFLPSPYEICVRDAQNKNFFSISQETKEQAARVQAREMYAQRLDLAKVKTEAAQTLKGIAESLERQDKELGSVEDAVRVQRELAARFPWMIDSALLDAAINGTDADHQLYQVLEQKLRYPTYLARILTYFRVAGGQQADRRDSDITGLAKDVAKKLEAAKQILAVDANVDLRTRQEAVETYHANREALDRLVSALGELRAMSKVLGDEKSPILSAMDKEAKKEIEARKKTAVND